MMPGRSYSTVRSREVSEKLAESGLQIQEELLMLSSLAADFDNFVIAMKTRDDLSNFSLLKQKLLGEGKRRKEKIGNDHAQSSSKQQQKKKFKGKCFICGVIAYYPSKCERKNNDNKQAMTMLAAAEAGSFNLKYRYIDSGTTLHICNDREMFVRFKDHHHVIAMAGNNHINVTGKVDVLIYNDNFEILLQKVLFSSELQTNFISVNKVVHCGSFAEFKSYKESRWYYSIESRTQKQHV